MDDQLVDEEVLDKFIDDPEFREQCEKQRPLREFSSALMRARLAAGISQTELARRIGVKQPMIALIARIENALQMPKVDTLMRLAKALGVDFTITASDTVKTQPHEVEAA